MDNRLFSLVSLGIFLFFLAVTVNTIMLSNAGAVSLKTQKLIVEWHDWAPQIFNTAKQQQRLILLDITAKWCQFCRKMDDVTYKYPQVMNVIKQNFIAVRADEANHPELVKRYKKAALPLTVVFDSNGNEIYKRSGYMKPQWMAWTLMAVLPELVSDNK